VAIADLLLLKSRSVIRQRRLFIGRVVLEVGAWKLLGQPASKLAFRTMQPPSLSGAAPSGAQRAWLLQRLRRYHPLPRAANGSHRRGR